MAALAALAIGAVVYGGGTAPAATEAADDAPIVSVALSESPDAASATGAPAAAATVPTTVPAPAESAPAEPAAPVAEAEVAPAAEATTEPATESASAITPDQPYTDDFATDSGNWSTMTGSWAVQAGTFVQSDPSGFDLITTLGVDLPAEYNVTVSMQAQGSGLGGGMVVGLSDPGSRRGAYLIDFTAGGTFLRWGRYDVDTGIYKYLGGLDVGTDVTTWNTLRVKIAESESTVFFNGAAQGTFDPVVGGKVGLVTSQSTVAFDDLVIEAL